MPGARSTRKHNRMPKAERHKSGGQAGPGPQSAVDQMQAASLLPAKPQFAPLTATTASGQKIEFRRVRVHMFMLAAQRLHCGAGKVIEAALAAHVRAYVVRAQSYCVSRFASLYHARAGGSNPRAVLRNARP